MKHSVGLASVLAAVLFLALSIPALSIEPPGPGEIEKYREDDSLEERIKFAKSLKNYEVHPSLIERKIAKIRALQEGRPFIPQTFPYSAGLPSHGTPRVLAILIDFPDYSHTNEESIFINKLFGTGDSGEFPYESLTEFYQRSSYDTLSIQGNVLGWYTAQYNRDHYGYGSWPYPGVKELIKEAMDYYNPTHDFSQYDNNNDGTIDYFCIFWAGPDGGWGSLWWAWCDITGYMFSGDPYAVDGKQLGIFSWQWEARPVGSEFAPETVIHETGHGLGLPDYYDYDSSVGPDGGVGGLDMMDSYGDHNAFSKWLLDWVTPTVVGDGGEARTLTLRASSLYPDCVTIMPDQIASDYFAEYFMVQNRSRLGNDQDIPADGLLIWHVDARLNDAGDNFRYDNSYTEHKLLRLMEADGLEEIETGDGRADAGDFYVQGNVFSPSSTPNSNGYVGGFTGVTVQNISAGSSTMTADFSISSSGTIILQVDPSSLDFGDLGKSSSKTMTFRAYNSGGGTLSGTISDNRNWITVSSTSFEGNDNTISVTVETDGLTESLTPYTGTVTVTSNGGTKTVEVSVTVIPTGVVGYPQPFSHSRHASLTFWGTSVAHAKIKIYTLAGELVKTLDETYGASKVSWDGRNDKGAKVAGGIYIVYTSKGSRVNIAVVK